MSDPSWEALLHALPHGPPLRVIDRIVAIDLQARRLTAQVDVRDDHPLVVGHFPGDPIWPGVGTLEAAAQATALLVGALQGTLRAGTLADAAGRFHVPVRPPAVLTLVVSITGHLSGVWRAEWEASVGITRVGSGRVAVAVGGAP